MARGWESKSVESQIESAKEHTTGAARPHSEEERARQRERQSLELSRKYVLHRLETSTNEHYSQSLRQALNDIEKKLAKLSSQ